MNWATVKSSMNSDYTKENCKVVKPPCFFLVDANSGLHEGELQGHSLTLRPTPRLPDYTKENCKEKIIPLKVTLSLITRRRTASVWQLRTC